jgi:hypothetical protein
MGVRQDGPTRSFGTGVWVGCKDEPGHRDVSTIDRARQVEDPPTDCAGRRADLPSPDQLARLTLGQRLGRLIERIACGADAYVGAAVGGRRRWRGRSLIGRSLVGRVARDHDEGTDECHSPPAQVHVPHQRFPNPPRFHLLTWDTSKPRTRSARSARSSPYATGARHPASTSPRPPEEPDSSCCPLRQRSPFPRSVG